MLRHGGEILYCFGSRGKEVNDFLDGRIPILEQGGSEVELRVKLGFGSFLPVREKVILCLELQGVLKIERVDLSLLYSVTRSGWLTSGP